jgi:hypothetical protein
MLLVTPDHFMILEDASASAGRMVNGRFTLLFNSDGNNPVEAYSGKSKSPRCFKGVRNLPVLYGSNTIAWVTASAFEDYLHVWGRQLVKKKNELCTYSGHLPNLSKLELMVH